MAARPALTGVASAPVVDAAVHVQFPHPAELRERLSPPWDAMSIPSLDRLFYVHPRSEFAARAEAGEGMPGSDPATVARQLFDEGGADYAILLPPGRNLQPAVAMESAIARALNDWMAERWLAADDRFRGSVRVSPRDPEAAVAEIERWAGDPRMVQVAVPLQAHAPYGQAQYLPVWEAAARHGLPVAVQMDLGSSIEYWPTPVGFPRGFPEYATLVSYNATYHLVNLVVEGVFDRLPDLRFVFAEGGYDALMAFAYRFNLYWRSARVELPWMERPPTECIAAHARFCTHRLEGPEDAELAARALEWFGGASLCLYGSHYPYWSFEAPAALAQRLPAAARDAVLGANALELYRLPVVV
jgi:predicted TIM-barrel fold metal-dependent hydrolase